MKRLKMKVRGLGTHMVDAIGEAVRNGVLTPLREGGWEAEEAVRYSEVVKHWDEVSEQIEKELRRAAHS